MWDSGGQDARVREAMRGGGTLGLGDLGGRGPRVLEWGNYTLNVRVLETVSPEEGAGQVLEGGGPGGRGEGPGPVRAGCV